MIIDWLQHVSVTNNLQLQDVYSIRGLNHGTTYDLKARLNTASNILRRGGKWLSKYFLGDSPQSRRINDPIVSIYDPECLWKPSPEPWRSGWGAGGPWSQGISVNSCINTLSRPRLPRSLLLYQKEWVKITFNPINPKVLLSTFFWSTRNFYWFVQFVYKNSLNWVIYHQT